MSETQVSKKWCFRNPETALSWTGYYEQKEIEDSHVRGGGKLLVSAHLYTSSPYFSLLTTNHICFLFCVTENGYQQLPRLKRKVRQKDTPINACVDRVGMEKKGNPKKLRGRILPNDVIFLNEKKQWTYSLREILTVFFKKLILKFWASCWEAWESVMKDHRSEDVLVPRLTGHHGVSGPVFSCTFPSVMAKNSSVLLHWVHKIGLPWWLSQ